MFNKVFIDIDKELYHDISSSKLTPEEIKSTYKNLVDFQPFFDLNQFLRKNSIVPDWVIGLSIQSTDRIFVFTYFCKQAPTFMLNEVFNLITQSSIQHQGNKHLINQILNQNGFKNFEQIVKDVFFQEMQNQLTEDKIYDPSDRYKDYMFLFQKTLNYVRKIQNSYSSHHSEFKDLYYDIQNVEKSLADLNSDFLTLYFLKMKERGLQTQSEWREGLKSFMPFFEKKVNYHLDLLSSYFDNYCNKKLAQDQTSSLKLQDDFQIVLVYVENLKDCFRGIVS